MATQIVHGSAAVADVSASFVPALFSVTVNDLRFYDRLISNKFYPPNTGTIFGGALSLTKHK
jgi:hypothetical protein